MNRPTKKPLKTRFTPLTMHCGRGDLSKIGLLDQSFIVDVLLFLFIFHSGQKMTCKGGIL